MIPAVAHFVWFGTELPWTHVLALRSARDRGGFDRLVLHCGDDLRRARWWPSVAGIDRLDVRPIDAPAIFDAAVATVGSSSAGPLVDLYRTLESPAARANMVRAAVLAAEGGVYLDLDTVTIASLDDLRATAGVFFGEERIALPATVVRRRRPDVLAVAGVRMAARELCRRLPGGWRHFRRIEHLYARGANNAVLAGVAGHPFLAHLLRSMVEIPPERRLRRYALGTHLLQDAARTWSAADADDQGGEARPGSAADGMSRRATTRDGPGGPVVIHPPEVFFPVAPEISEHWFRIGGSATAADLVRPETRVVHWYASVRTAGAEDSLTPRRLAELEGRQPFAELVAPFATSNDPSSSIS